MKKKLLALLSAVALMLTFALPVLAADPTVMLPDISGPTINSVDVYEHYLADNDTLVVVNCDVEYTVANLPTLTIDQTFLGRFTDNLSIELGAVTPYPYYNSGYSKGVFAIYWPYLASNQPVWNSACSAKFQGVPTGVSWNGTYATPPYTSSPTLNWHTTGSMSTTSTLLGANVIFWATSLGNTWHIALTTVTPSGTKLSSYGEQYFVSAIPGLRTACPQIFMATSYIPQVVYPLTPSPTPGVTAPAALWPFDTTGIASWFIPGGSDAALRMIGFMVLMCFIAFAATAKSGRGDLAMMLIVGSIPMACAMGGLPMQVVFVVGLLCALVIGFVLILQRGAV